MTHAAGIDWAVRDTGPPDGPPLLLLHGFPESGRCWDRVAPLLAARGHRVIAPDLPGHGDSGDPPAPPTLDALAGWIVALADALGIGRFALAGHDWGGLAAWSVAACHPDRLTRLTILDAPHPDGFWEFRRRHPTQSFRSLYVAFFQLPWLPELALRAGDFALLRRSLPAAAYNAADLAAYATAWARPDRLTAMLGYYRARSRPRGRITVPTRILWGARDAYLDPRLAAASAQFCDDAVVAIHPASGHWLPREAPGWVADQLGEHL